MQSRIWRTLLLIAFVAPVWALSGCGSGGDGGACGPANCGGCCLLGQCVMPSGQNGAACGAGGAVCTPCAQGQTCDAQLGGCVAFGTDMNPVGTTGNTPCGSTCSGCCDPLTNKCVDVATQNDQNCGMSNQDCRQCASAEHCSSGRCRRGGGTSAGECDPTMECFSQQSGRCELGLTRQFCGMGNQCMQCATNEWCIDGSCQPGNTAMDSCLATCSGRGCCNKDGRCIQFAKSSSDGFLSSLFADSTLSNVQNDVNCGMEACIKCPAGYSCDAQVGECVDKRYMRDFRICIKRVVVDSPPKDDKCVGDCDALYSDNWAHDLYRSCVDRCPVGGSYSSGGGDWWDNLLGGDWWGEKKPDIRVKVRAGTQSGQTKSKTGREGKVTVLNNTPTLGATPIVTEYTALRCLNNAVNFFSYDYWATSFSDACKKTVDSELRATYDNGSYSGYVVTYGSDCPIRVNEDALRGAQLEFVVEEVDLLGSPIGSCTGEVVGWQGLAGTCDRTGRSRCLASAVEGIPNKDLEEEIKNNAGLQLRVQNCYSSFQGCEYSDGLVGVLPIRITCGGDHVKMIEATARLVRAGTFGY